MALVFPLSMLMMQMSDGGIGGAVTAARALGAGRSEEAGRLAQQSLITAFVLASAFTATLLGFGRSIFAAMGRSSYFEACGVVQRERFIAP